MQKNLVKLWLGQQIVDPGTTTTLFSGAMARHFLYPAG